MLREVDPFIATLRQVRRRNGLSVRALAEKAGLSPATLRAAEEGRHVIGLDKVRPWAAALGLRVDLVEDHGEGPWLVWLVREHRWYGAPLTDSANVWLASRFNDRVALATVLAEADAQPGHGPAAAAVDAPERHDGTISVADITRARSLMFHRVEAAVRALEGLPR